MLHLAACHLGVWANDNADGLARRLINPLGGVHVYIQWIGGC